jgi:copper chaperone NosL
MSSERNPTRWLFVAAGLISLLACAPSGPEQASAVPLEITEGSVCSLDGMLLAEFPGPKAQIHYRGVAQPEMFCDTKEMFSAYLMPEQARRVDAMYVQDMGQADWARPRGHWIDATKAWYVFGSNKHGAMGPTIASFSTEDMAMRFAGHNGGTVHRFDQVTADMVNLDGGALHDAHM